MSFRKFYDGHEQLNEETPYDRKQRAMVVNLSQAYRMFISGMRDNNKTRMNNAKKRITEIESKPGSAARGKTMIKFKNYLEEADKAGKSLADKAKKSGISAKTLRTVFNRGKAAWKTGHRPKAQLQISGDMQELMHSSLRRNAVDLITIRI